VDDIPQIGAGPVSPVVGVEPFLEPGAKDPLCVEGAVMIDDCVVPPQIFDVQLGVAERRRHRLEAENPLRLELDDFGLAIVPDEVRAGERAENLATRFELELDLGLAADAVPPLLGDEQQELLDIVIANPRQEELGI